MAHASCTMRPVEARKCQHRSNSNITPRSMYAYDVIRVKTLTMWTLTGKKRAVPCTAGVSLTISLERLYRRSIVEVVRGHWSLMSECSKLVSVDLSRSCTMPEREL